MGLRKLFARTAPQLQGLPSGSFTLDREGHVLVGTVRSTFPTETLQEIGRLVLDTFRDAQTVQLPLSELIVNYGGLKITARELRGGAIVFLSPTSPISTAQ